jgi:glycosyltransferase involved in cell wall biosynthesis
VKILVYPHDLRIGGSQTNAIELGAAVRDLGHSVVIFGQPGTLMRRVRELDLEFIPAPTPRKRPSPTVCGALGKLARDRSIDILHGYEWPPALECLIASKLAYGSTSMATVMSMAVAPFIPATMPLLVGTEQILKAESAFGRQRVGLMEPPIDVVQNSPSAAVGHDKFRERFGLARHAQIVVCVSRLARELKLEGILAAMDAVAGLARNRDVRLVIVGDGPGMREAVAKASVVNDRLGRPVVLLTGELDDPRPAYAAGDVVLGMGGSALRGLSFGKPLVVQGERGFWELLTPETLDRFLWQGWYGVGNGTEVGMENLTSILGFLLDNGHERAQLGSFGRQLVEDRFSLTNAARVQVQFYRRSLAESAGTLSTLWAEAAAGARYAAYVGHRRLHRYFGRNAADDFNAKPVASLTSLAVRGRSR